MTVHTFGLVLAVLSVLAVPPVWYAIGGYLFGYQLDLSTALWSSIAWGILLCVTPMEKPRS